MSSVEGPDKLVPVLLKQEPWHGQSHSFSWGFHCIQRSVAQYGSQPVAWAALTRIKSKQRIKARLTRWSEYLQMFTFKWHYRPGKSNVADFGSLACTVMPWSCQQLNTLVCQGMLCHCIYCITTLCGTAAHRWIDCTCIASQLMCNSGDQGKHQVVYNCSMNCCM